MTWYRSTTKDRLSYERLSTSSEEYLYAIYRTSTASLVEMINCSLNLFRDTYSIAILNFTREKNGYYWCQLVINNTNTQPSHYAWFYTDQTCSSYQYFRLASLNETQCAQRVASTSPSITPTISLSTSTTTLSTNSQTISSAISQTSSSNEKLLIYVLGSFSALLFIALLGVLVLAFSFALYVHHLRNKTSKLIFMIYPAN